MKLYLVNFATDDDWQCALDDGMSHTFDNVADFAEPRGWVTTDLKSIARFFLDDVIEMYREDMTGDKQGKVPAPVKFKWKKVGKTHWNLMRSDIPDDEPEGVMIIRHVGTVTNFKEAKR